MQWGRGFDIYRLQALLKRTAPLYRLLLTRSVPYISLYVIMYNMSYKWYIGRRRYIQGYWINIDGIDSNGQTNITSIGRYNGTNVTCTYMYTDLAAVPLTIFRSSSKFDQNLECSSLKCAQPITTKCCTRHDSVAVVTCATFRCDRLNTF